jgi:hypothetical protein
MEILHLRVKTSSVYRQKRLFINDDGQEKGDVCSFNNNDFKIEEIY